MKIDFNDLTLVPEIISEINSRSECNVYRDGKLPIMTAPMFDVINDNNVNLFSSIGMITIAPRNSWGWLNNLQKSNNQFDFQAFGLEEEIPQSFKTSKQGILIDIANGHMRKLLERIKFIKNEFPECPLMVGNIANPKTFIKLSLAGADYVRCGIGGGTACTTSANVGVHYPMASLIQETYELKKLHGLNTKIVADGGMKNYSDIIKALALGADYVMLGSIISKSYESSAEKFIYKDGNYTPYNGTYNDSLEIYSKYSGMSTKLSQKKMGNNTLKTGEGVTRYLKVEYSIYGWVENFTDYLRSALSYTNSLNLETFKESEKVMISQNAFKRFDK